MKRVYINILSFCLLLEVFCFPNSTNSYFPDQICVSIEQPSDSVVKRIEVTPTEIVTYTGQKVALKAIPKDQNGTPIESLILTWSTNCDSVGNLTPNGYSAVFDAKSPGECSIYVEYDRNTIAQVPVKVRSIEDPPCLQLDKSYLNFGWLDSKNSKEEVLKLRNCGKSEIEIVANEDSSWFDVSPSTYLLLENASIELNVKTKGSGLVSPSSLAQGKLKIKWENKINSIFLYGYTRPSPITIKKQRPQYTGWTGMCGNAGHTSSVQLIDAPIMLSPKIIWQNVDWELSTATYNPTIWNNKMIKAYDDGYSKGVQAYDLATGDLLWQTESLVSDSTEKLSNPSLYMNKVLVISGGKMICLNALDGSLAWDYGGSYEIIGSRPVMGNGNVYSAGDLVRCNELESGRLLWSAGEKFSKIYTDVNLAGGYLYFTAYDLYSETEDVTVFCLNSKNGKTVWKKDFRATDLLSVVSDGRIFRRYNDSLICINANNGSEMWRYVSSGLNNYSVPSVLGLNVLLNDDQNIVCIDARNGKQKWVTKTPGILEGVPILAGVRIYTCVKNHGVYCYNAANGKLLAGAIKDAPLGIYTWDGVIVGEGTIIGIYETDSGKKICCYSDTDRFVTEKPRKSTALVFSLNSDNLIIDSTWLSRNQIKMKTKPFITANLHYLPIKIVIEGLGGTTVWDDKNKKITCKLEDKTLEVWEGKRIVKLNGKDYPIDSKNTKLIPLLSPEKFISLPAGFFAQIISSKYYYIADIKTIIMTYIYMKQ